MGNMHTIRCDDTMASGAFEAAEYFMQHKRQTRVAISNRYTDEGQPAIVWCYKGPRKDIMTVYNGLTMEQE